MKGLKLSAIQTAQAKGQLKLASMATPGAVVLQVLDFVARFASTFDNFVFLTKAPLQSGCSP